MQCACHINPYFYPDGVGHWYWTEKFKVFTQIDYLFLNRNGVGYQFRGDPWGGVL
jgi:hypothetical protein